MKSIVITSQKGGSCKATTVPLLAVEAERSGAGPAWMIDTDQQGSLSRWYDRRKSEAPQLAEVPFNELKIGLANVARKYSAAFCFIDTAPAILSQSAGIIALVH